MVWMKRSALPLVLGRIGSDADMAQAEHPADLAEQARDVARTIVGHHPLDPAALALEPAQGTDQEAGGRLAPLVRQDLDVSEPRGVVDRDVHELPAELAVLAMSVAGDALPMRAKRASFLVSRWISSPARARS
jgi:hypothetical protein